MAPYASEDAPRWDIVGSDIAVSDQAATTLALFVHELSTNSVRYSALEVDDGHVAITIDGSESIRTHWQKLAVQLSWNLLRVALVTGWRNSAYLAR